MNPFASVLYFPSIEIQNDQWLKSTLLLWDNVYRIVPSTYQPDDSFVVRTAADHGLVRPITLEAADFSSICVEFRSFLDRLPWLPDGLDGRKTDRLHKDKIDSQLYPALEQLATYVDPQGFLELPADLSRGYMMYLARAVAGRRNLATITDDRHAWTVSPFFRERANFGEIVMNDQAASHYCSLIFDDLIPFTLGPVDIREIISFVEKHRDERENLRQAIAGFAKELAECESPSHAADLRAQYVSRLESAKNDFRRSMSFYNQEDSHALMTIGLPTAATIYGALGSSGSPFDLWKISGSILMGAVAAYADYDKVKRINRKDSSVSFLVDVDDRLIGSKKIPRYEYIFEEFMND